MKINELIDLLSRFNLKANISILIDNTPHKRFDVLWGDSDGSEMENCENVYVYLEDNNKKEKTNK